MNDNFTTSGKSDLQSRVQSLYNSINGVSDDSEDIDFSDYGLSVGTSGNFDILKSTEDDDRPQTIEDYTNTDIDSTDEDSISTDSVQTQLNYEQSKQKANKVYNANIDDNRSILEHIADPVFAFTEGILAQATEIPAGRMALNHREHDDIMFQKEFLETQKEMNKLESELNKAYLNQDSDKVQELYPEYDAVKQAYLSMFDQYREMAAKPEYYSKYASQESIDGRLNALNDGLLRIEKENKEYGENLQTGRDVTNWFKSIYSPTETWKQLEQAKWWYQVPRGLGTSVTSLVAGGANIAAVSLANGATAAALSAAPASATGVYAPLVIGGSAVVAVGTTALTSIVSRNYESLQEVSEAYKGHIQEAAEAYGITVDDIAENGREKLRVITGREYSEDESSDEYRSNEQVLEDMLAYDVPLGNKELEAIQSEAKGRLQNLYNRNMMLGLGDFAEAAVVIPGAGKAFGKVLGKLNITERAVNGTVKTLDNIIAKVAPKVSKANRKLLTKYVINPTVRVTTVAALEGTEEVTQFVHSKEAFEKDEDEFNLFNPFDAAKMFIDNKVAALKGLLGVADVSWDPSLNNNPELKNSFKVGTAVGLLMGGTPNIVSSAKDIKAYSAGRNIARQIMVDNIKGSEDFAKYVKYGEMMNKHIKFDAFSDGIDTQLEDGAIPDGWTREDLEAEKQNAKDIYNIMRHNKSVTELKKEDRPIAAAFVKHNSDMYKQAVEDYNKFIKTLDVASIEKEITEFSELNKIDPANQSIVEAFFRLQANEQYLNSTIQKLESLSETVEDSKPFKNMLDLLYQKQSKLTSDKSKLEKLIKQAKLDKVLTDDASLPAVSEQLGNFYINEIFADERVNHFKNLYLNNKYQLGGSKYANLKEAVEFYKDMGIVGDYAWLNGDDVYNSLQDEDKYEDADDSVDSVDSGITVGSESDIVPTDATEESTTKESTEEPTEEPTEIPSESDTEEDTTDTTESESVQTDSVPEEIINTEDNTTSESESEPEPSDVNDAAVEPEGESGDIDNNTKEHPELVYGTLFYRKDAMPLMEGYESGEDLNKFMSTPGNFNKCTFEAIVGEQDSKWGTYDPADKATWDNAAIYIKITAPDGKKYITAFKNVSDAISLYRSRGQEMTEDEIQKFRDLRNTIIAAKLADKDCIITFQNKRITNGEFNTNTVNAVSPSGITYEKSINRKLTEVKGLGVPADLKTLFDSEIVFGIGKGIADNNIIMDKDGMPLQGVGHSGTIYIYPAPKDMVSGTTVPIKLNEARFANEDGTPTELAKYIAKVIIYRETGDDGLYADDLIRLVLNYSENTLIKNNDPRYSFLADKQFYINYKENWVQLGKDRYTVSQIRTDQGVELMTRFIADNLHWNTEKNLMWRPLPKSFKQWMIDNNKDHLRITEGLEFDLEDVGLKRENGRLITDPENKHGLSTLAWMIKHGKLLSDLNDQITTNSFMYVDQPVVSHPTTKEEQKSEAAAQEPVDKEFDLYSASFSEGFEDTESSTDYDEATDANSDFVNNFFGLDGAPKIGNKNQVKQSKYLNTKKAVKWLKKKLGLTDEQIEIVDGFIKEFANGEVVYGIARLDSIGISNLAKEGVQYHEAWHRVSLLMLDKDTRAKLYEEYRKQHPAYYNVTNSQVEEAIADEFMDYMLNDKQSSLRYYINKIFRNIKKFLHLNSKLTDYDLKQMFDAIKYGDFKKYALNEESYKAFADAYKDGAYYKIGPNTDYTPVHFLTINDFHSALDSLKACLFVANGAKYISDITNLSNNKLRSLLQSFRNRGDITQQQKEALGEIIEHFDIFMYELKPELEQMGIRQIDEDADAEFEAIESGATRKYDEAPYEFSKKNNALASVKMFIGTLSDTYFDYTYHNGEPVKTLKTRKSTITGLPMIMDYDTAYELMLRNLSTVETFHEEPGKDPETSLLGRCARLGKHNAFFAYLYKRLNQDIDINLQTQILQTVKSFDQNFTEISFAKDDRNKFSFKLTDSANKRAIKQYPSTWSDLFFNSEMVIRTDDSISLNIPQVTIVIGKFNELYKKVSENKNMTNTDVNIYIGELVSILNSIGIDVDDLTIEHMLPNDRVNGFRYLMMNNNVGAIKYLFNDTLSSLINLKKDGKFRKNQRAVQLDKIFVGLSYNNFINKLAEAQALSHPDGGTSVLGPNNNIVQTKTQNCYVSDLFRWMNEGDEIIMKALNQDTYCRSSIILNTVNEGNKVKLNTFLNFYGEGTKDKGRDYLSISPVEDYIAKMTFTWNNHIIFPTMADKKTWFTISGVQLFNKELNIKNANGRMHITFNREALNALYNYWLDEFDTIVEYYKSLPNLNKDELINNYHSKGKGGLFRHFTGYWVKNKQTGQNEWVDLNKALADGVKNNNVENVLDAIKEELFTTPINTYRKINQVLQSELKQEINTCLELGLIQRGSNGLLQNKALDETVFNHFVEIYRQNIDTNISNNAEYFALLTMIGNHMVNNNVSIIETEKIITGDVAFFKGDDDKIKRLGSVLSTGDNLRTQWIANKPENQLEYTRLQRRQTYNATVINDNEIVSAQFNEMKSLFTYAYTRNLLIEKEGLSEAQVDELMQNVNAAREKYPIVFGLAEELAEDDSSAYGPNKKGTKGNINQADAAVYISPRMYRDIVQMLGEWSDEIAEAYDIMEGDADWLSDPELYAKSLKTLIKPLKTTYFGYTYHDSIKHNVPIFNKMAMFPMFKVLATGDNLELYNRMNLIGDQYKGLQRIDQVAFESAVKVGIEGSSDFYTDYKNEAINDLSNMHITKQYFRNLRRQLITDPHTHDRTLFGTQVSTVAVSNLIEDRVYGENKGKHVTGKQIKNQLFGTINAISNRGFAQVKEIFLDEDGNVDFEKTSVELVKEAHNSNMGKDVEDALKLNETRNGFDVPLAALPDSKWVETKLISINNKKSIDLELPGGAFIQMSSFGFKSIKAVSDKAINGGKRLLNLRKDGSMDALISINLFSHIIPNYENMSFTEAKQWLIDNNIIGDKAGAVALGYRIPTQGLSSISGLHIADVLPSVVGDTIVLPDEFTTQTGSDFDIDKLYIARYNYEQVETDAEDVFEKWYNQHLVFTGGDKKHLISQYGNKENARKAFIREGNNRKTYKISKDGKIVKYQFQKVEFVWDIANPESSYAKNSREANENLLLETYLTVLTDNKNVDETRLPLDKVTDIIKGEILPIVDGVNAHKEFIPLSEVSPTYQMNKKYEYSGGKTGIGPFALNNKHHILTQLTKLKFAEIELLEALGFEGLDGIKSRNETVAERNMNQSSEDFGQILHNEDGSIKYKMEEGLRILDWISAMINAHVDVAKDPYVIRLNVRQYTYNLCNFLLRVGYGKDTFYFLPQPILKEMASAYDRAQGIYGLDETQSKTSIVNEEINTIRKSYYDNYIQYCKNLGEEPRLILDKYGKLTLTQAFEHNGEKLEVPVNVSTIARSISQRDFLIQQLQDSRKLNELSNEELKEYYYNQLVLSQLFLELNELAQDMSKLVQLSQVDTKKFGNNFVEQDRFMYRLKSLIVNTVLFKSEDIQNFLEETFLSTKINNGIVGPSQMFENLMIRSKQEFKDKISQVLTMIGRIDSNDEALNKTISNELEGQLRYGFINAAGVSEDDIFNMFYGSNTMAKRLARIKNDILNGLYPEMLTQDGKIANLLLNYLGTLTKMSTDTYAAPDIITKNRIQEDDKFLKQKLHMYYQELIESPHQEIRDFMNDLFTYQLITTCGNFTKNGIFNLTPIQTLKDSGYADYIGNIVESFNSSDIDFDNFFLNNWSDNKLVKPLKIYESDIDPYDGRVIKKDKYPMLLAKNRTESGDTYPLIILPKQKPIGRNSIKQTVYTPYIKIRTNGDRSNPANTIVYRYVGNYVDDNNETRPVYVVTNKKGLNQNGRVIKEYDSHSNSAFKFNNIENSLYVKSPITYKEIIGLIKNAGLDRKVTKDGKQMSSLDRWSDLINDMELVRDYTPSTVALREDFEDIRVTKVEDRSEKTNAPTGNNTQVQQSSTTGNQNIGYSFTFPNGFTVALQFKLNEQQENALNTLYDFINNPSKYNGRITLAGYAGTGKTTIISIFNKYLLNSWKEPIFSSPTHRANAVTKMNNPDATVKTLHSLFGLSNFVDFEKGGYDLRNLKSQQVRDAKIKPGDLLIVDEASMVGQGLYDFIKSYVDSGDVNVIFVGDPKQLSPVNDVKISPVFTSDGTVLELTKVERTGDNPILEEATNLRNDKDFNYKSKTVSTPNGEEGVVYMNDGITTDETIKSIVNDPAYKINPFYFRILSATNAMLPTVNAMVRKQLFGKDAAQIENGDILIGFDNLSTKVGKKQVDLIENSIDYKVIDVEPSKQTIELMQLNAPITIDGFKVQLENAATGDIIPYTIFVLSNNTPADVLNKISQEFELVERGITDAFAKQDYQTANMLLEIKSQLKLSTVLMQNYEVNGKLRIKKTIDYGYAHTIHKSQGGTYNKVMIYADTITGARFDADTQQQLKYVAMSRAKNNVYVVTNHSFESEVKPVAVTTDSQMPKVSSSQVNYTRELVTNNPRTLYIFTDNTDRTSFGNQIESGWYYEKYHTGYPIGWGTDRNPTSAIIRGLENTAPISTMKWFYKAHKESNTFKTRYKAQWTDSDIKQFETVVSDEISNIKRMWDSGNFDNVVFPKAGPNGDSFLDSSIAQITKQRTPLLYNYLKQQIDLLQAYINGSMTDKKANVYVMYQGHKTTERDDRKFNYWTAYEGEAKTYGSNITTNIISTDGFLHAAVFNEGSMFTDYTDEYKQLKKQFESNGKIFNLFDNSKEGLEIQSEFFEFIKSKGYKGLDYMLPRFVDPKSDYDAAYVITFGIDTNNDKKQQDKQLSTNPTMNTNGDPSTYVLHSGGANGSDTMWGKIGEQYGMQNDTEHIRHYYLGEKTPNGTVQISQQDATEGATMVAKAAQANWGYKYSTMKNQLLIRDWTQVKYSDAVFAIGHLIPKNTKISNTPNETRMSIQTMVTGGTGYAVEMAKQAGKPVYVYDQIRKQWYSNINGKWSRCDVPTLTTNFAGIGTREINQDGINAIHAVFKKSFGSNAKYNKAVATNNAIKQVLGNDEHADSEIKSAVSTAKKGISFTDTLSTVNPVFTQAEIAQIKQAIGPSGKLHVMSVSRQTDPAFFAKEIIKFLEENSAKSFTDPTRVNVIELWSKHDGEPIQDILQACKKYKVAPMVSFSITTLGDTALEKGVLKYQDLLPLIEKLVSNGDLDPRTTTIRIDPILVGVTDMNAIKDVVNKCKAMGFKKFVTSLVQSYGSKVGTADDRKVISGIDEALAKEGKTYDWDKYYGRNPQGKINFVPKQKYIQEVGNVLLELNKDNEIEIESCSFAINGLKPSACLDPLIIERITGVDVTSKNGTYDRDTSRPFCMCYGAHSDMYRRNEKNCYSSCAYCYAAHSGDNAFEYYNEDGSLKDRPLTRVNEVTGENIASKTYGGSELGQKLTNPMNNIGFTYKGKEYINSEHAYQTWKSGEFNQAGYDKKGGKVSSKLAPNNYDIMVDIIKAKLTQNPELISEIDAKGGNIYLQKSKHVVFGKSNDYWESTGQNKFIEALTEAYNLVKNDMSKPQIEHNFKVTTNAETIESMKAYQDIETAFKQELKESGLTDDQISEKVIELQTAISSEDAITREQMQGIANKIICK